MVNYNNTKIYYIPVGNDRYYGHTTQKLCQRKRGHKGDMKRFPSYKLYTAIKDAGMTESDIHLVWVEDYPCERKEQAEARERYYIEQYATLNMVVPTRTWKERYEANKELISQKRKDYRVENREEFSRKQKEYYVNNLEKESERKAKFYAENKEVILQKYHEGKEEHNAKRRARYALKDKEALNAIRREKSALKRANAQQS